MNERQKQLVRQLHSLLVGPQATPEKTGEVLEYFFEKLTGSSIAPRRLALKVSQVSWGLNRTVMPTIPYPQVIESNFKRLKPKIFGG